MFSDHLKKVDDAPAKVLFLVAAGLVIACQLVAMVMVVDGQVRKAQLRDSHYTQQRQAVIRCMDTTTGFARQSCLDVAYGDAPATSLEAYGEGRAVAQLPDYMDGSGAVQSSRSQGFMPAAFTTSR